MSAQNDSFAKGMAAGCALSLLVVGVIAGVSTVLDKPAPPKLDLADVAVEHRITIKYGQPERGSNSPPLTWMGALDIMREYPEAAVTYTNDVLLYRGTDGWYDVTDALRGAKTAETKLNRIRGILDEP